MSLTARFRVIGQVLLVLLFSACSEDDYYYPSVKLEFVTVCMDADDHSVTLIPDKGDVLEVVENKSDLRQIPESGLRVVANYEPLEDKQAIIYGMAEILSPCPEPASSDLFSDGIKTDPVTLESIWLGRRYLNMVLQVRLKNGIHYFHFVEERVEETESEKKVTLLLYHDARGDMQAYTQDVYASVPLAGYICEKKLSVLFVYYNESGERIQTGPFVVETDF